ncbi:FAD-binding protein [Brucella sp. BE17]|uniref:FAD-binding protein n=1 Tax=Brucella sp. BE17 TaxID=3142977 RepID=UPI0031B9D3EE
MSSQSRGHILITGAGVAGLSAALELAARGWQITVCEKAEKLSEVGAGLQLAPNAMRHLTRLGVAEPLAGRAVSPDVLYLVDGRKARPLLAMPIGEIALKRWHSPYLVCHRADLQSALLCACLENPAIDINLNAEIVRYQSTGNGIKAEIRSGEKTETLQASWLLGCDGVWSAQRAAAGLSTAQFSGHIAWRTTLAKNALPASFTKVLPEHKAVSAWLGAGVHFIAYPVKGGEFFNFVAITHGNNPGATWSRTGDHQRLKSFYSGWCDAVRDVIAVSPDWTYWPLFEMKDAQFVCNNRLILLGDAAHAVTPFAAQGAAMAIEDAAALAQALEQSDTHNALRHYDAVRKTRLAAVARRGKLNRFAYHAGGPLALGRNLLFAARPPEAFLKDMDWLYGYDAIAAVERKVI